MGVAYNPRIVTNGLILHLDAGNYHKSYPTEKQLITSGLTPVTINSSSPTTGGVQYASIHATGWNLTNGQIPRYSYVALTYTISSNTALNSSGQAITTGTLQGTQFGPGDIIDNSLPGVPLSQGTHTLYFSADGEVYAPNSAERRVLYVAVSSAISSGSIVISSAKLLYANKIYDMGGQGRNGTLTNGPTYNSSNGGSIVFDGLNDYTQIGYDGAGGYLNSSQNRTEITVDCFVKLNALGSDQVFFQVGGYLNSCVLGCLSNNKARFLVRKDGDTVGGVFDKYVDSTTTLTSGQWYHIVGSKTSSTMKIFINGVEETSISTSFVWNTGTETPVWVGRNNSQSSLTGTNNKIDELNGAIGSIKIYQNGLTPFEVQQNFNATRGRYGI